MGLLSYLRGDDLLENSSTQPTGEARSLPRPDNELPLSDWSTTIFSGPTFWKITPVDALAIADFGRPCVFWPVLSVRCRYMFFAAPNRAVNG